MNFGQAGTMTCGSNRVGGGGGRDEQCSISPPLASTPWVGGKNENVTILVKNKRYFQETCTDMYWSTVIDSSVQLLSRVQLFVTP